MNTKHLGKMNDRTESQSQAEGNVYESSKDLVAPSEASLSSYM
jgi:hypothetical protein